MGGNHSMDAWWQRSFHDHIIRNDADMDRICTYIASNPALWHDDAFFT